MISVILVVITTLVVKPAEVIDDTIEVAVRGKHRDLIRGPFMAPVTGVATTHEEIEES